MFQLKGGVDDYGDDVKSNVFLCIVKLRVLVGSTYQVALFCFAYEFFGIPKFSIASRFYLYHHQPFSVLSNDVDLRFCKSPVSVHNFVAVFNEEFYSFFLAKFAKFIVVSHVIVIGVGFRLPLK